MVRNNPKTPKLSPMAGDTNIRGGIGGLGSLVYICDRVHCHGYAIEILVQPCKCNGVITHGAQIGVFGFLPTTHMLNKCEDPQFESHAEINSTGSRILLVYLSLVGI